MGVQVRALSGRSSTGLRPRATHGPEMAEDCKTVIS
jgi:hypothetical protein